MPRNRGRVKTDGEVKGLVGANITQATGWLGGEVSGERARNLDYYYGRRLSTDDTDDAEVEDGHSRWISSDVQDTVEAMMPDLMEIFASSDQIFVYEPTEETHEAFSDQATDYVNYVIWNDNDGFALVHDFVKDSLLQKNGYMKSWWNPIPEVKQETLTGVSSMVLAIYQEDPDIEILEVTAEEAPAGSEMIYPDGTMWSIKMKRFSKGRVQIETVAPEYMLTSRYAKMMDENIRFACDFQDIPRGDLIADGFDPDIVERIPPTADDQPRATREGFARWRDEDNYGTGWSDNQGGATDQSTESIRVYDAYILMDYEGTGVPRRYNVKCAGQGESPTLLPDPETDQIAVEVDDHPYTDVTPIRMPHKMIGRAIADLAIDIQDVKSTAVREMLNEMYYANNQRYGLSNKANLDDFLTNRPGGGVRVDTDGPDVAGHIAEIRTQGGVGAVVMNVLQYMDEVGRNRTGANNMTALDPQALHQTWGGANLMLGERQKRLLLIARTIAETGMRGWAKKLLQIVVNNQDFERTVQLRGKWVRVRPDRWNASMNVRTQVGLGHGTKTQKMMTLDHIMQTQEKVVSVQGGLNGPFVGAEEIANSLRELTNAGGWSDSNIFFNTDVDQLPPPEPKGPDAAMILAQAEQTKAQADLMKAENDRLKLQLEAVNDQANLQLEARQSEAKFLTDAAGRTEDQRQHDEKLAYQYTELAAKTGVAQDKILADAEKAERQMAIDIFRDIGRPAGNA